MNYAEIRNNAGSQMIDDTYENFRLSWAQPFISRDMGSGMVTGVHVEVNEKGERVCTYPYLDIANGVSWIWPSGAFPQGGPRFEAWKTMSATLRTFGASYYIGSPFIGIQTTEGVGHDLVRPTLLLFGGETSISRSLKSGIMISRIMAIASAMPNIIYTFTQFATKKNFELFNPFPFQYRINLWQRAASVELPIYERGTFAGNDVGYTELERVAPYIAPYTSITCRFKTKDNEKFKHWTFEQEARFSTMLFVYGLEDSTIKSDYGEMIIKNERGEIIFNNRYDYMRILKYFPSINTLKLEGKNLRNRPQRFSFPGRKIAVAALHPYACIANTRKGRPSYMFNTGFWFPDPSTVEFTSCASMIESNFDGYYSANQSCVNMAELINVMILDVTGCSPGWRAEVESRGKWTGFSEFPER